MLPVLFIVISGGTRSRSGGGLGECGGGGGAGDAGGEGESVSRSTMGSNSGAKEPWEGDDFAKGVFLDGGDDGGLSNGLAELEAVEAPVGIGVRFGVRNGLCADIGFAISGQTKRHEFNWETKRVRRRREWRKRMRARRSD